MLVEMREARDRALTLSDNLVDINLIKIKLSLNKKGCGNFCLHVCSPLFYSREAMSQVAVLVAGSLGYMNYKDIRYTEIIFTIEIIENTKIVRYKASAIRGGIGEMLLRSHCIYKERECRQCGFQSECIVNRMMHSYFEILPKSVHMGDSVGYIVYCGNTKQRFQVGDRFDFQISLFGKNIVYFSEYINAIYALGISGLGRNRSHFQIVSIKNIFGKPILQGSDILMENYKWQYLGDYIQWRRGDLKRHPDDSRGNKKNLHPHRTINFISPASIKNQGKMSEFFSSDALANSLWRRLYILGCFENLNNKEEIPEKPVGFPEILEQSVKVTGITRYSGRKNQRMELKGIWGKVQLGEITEEWMDILLAGEIVQIGKNTSFGFGKYKLE